MPRCGYTVGGGDNGAIPDCGDQDTYIPMRVGDGPWFCGYNDGNGIRG